MRLDNYLAKALHISRKDAQRLVRQQRVEIAGELCRQASAQVDEATAIRVDGEPVLYQEHFYFMLNKPDGYVCATSDPSHASVLSLIVHPVVDKLHIVGRLDVDTTGLLLLTTNGDWTHHILSPKKSCGKTYHVDLAEPITTADIQQLETGIILRGEDKPTLPAVVEVMTPTQVKMTITEGRYHQVKRMFAAVGNNVVKLHRESIGAIRLDPDLATGKFRMLTEAEVISVKS